MPDVKLSMDGTLIDWLKSVGDAVKQGEVIATFDADKATVEVEASASGVVQELKFEPGAELTEGTVIAVIGAHRPAKDHRAFMPLHGRGQVIAQAGPANIQPVATLNQHLTDAARNGSFGMQDNEDVVGHGGRDVSQTFLA